MNYEKSFYLMGKKGNNAFSYERRGDEPRLFVPGMEYIDFLKARAFILEHARTASLITVATSPFFIEQERATSVLKKLFR